MLNMHVHMSLLEALLGEHKVSRQLATESPERERERERDYNPCRQQAVHFGPCRRANILEFKMQLRKMSKCALGLRLVKFFLH